MQVASILFTEYAMQFCSRRCIIKENERNRFGKRSKRRNLLAPVNSEESRVNFNDGRFGRLSKIAYSSMAYADSLQSYPNGASNRAPDCIPPSFFCLSVSPFPSIPVATSTNPRGDSLGFGLCGFAARHIEVEHASVRHGVCSSRSPRRIRQIRYFAFSPPLPRPILNSEFG